MPFNLKIFLSYSKSYLNIAETNINGMFKNEKEHNNENIVKKTDHTMQ